MYFFSSRVRYSETDETGNLSLSGLMDYLQDCCLFQSEYLGVGPEYLRERHCLWLVTGWQIVIDRYPQMFEPIRVETIPYRFSGCLGCRNVLIRDEQNRCIVKANSTWVYLNTDTWKPEKPEKSEILAYGTEDPAPMDYAPRKILMPEKMSSEEKILVTQHFIDTNHHMNNAQYVELAKDLTDENMTVKELRAEYKKQARLGDILYPKTGKQGGWHYVSMENEKGQPCFSAAMR